MWPPSLILMNLDASNAASIENTTRQTKNIIHVSSSNKSVNFGNHPLIVETISLCASPFFIPILLKSKINVKLTGRQSFLVYKCHLASSLICIFIQFNYSEVYFLSFTKLFGFWYEWYLKKKKRNEAT